MNGAPDDSQFVNVERERERKRAEGGPPTDGGQTEPRQCGGGRKKIFDVVDVDAQTTISDGRTEPDKTAGGGTTQTAFRVWNGGDTHRSGTSTSGSTIPNVLDVAVPEKPGRQRAKAYNPDPRVDDFENADEVMEFWLDS